MLNDKKLDDFTGQIDFFKFINQQPLQKFRFPKILDYNDSPYPYMIIEYVNGEALGYLDKIKKKYYRQDLVNAVFSGVMELQQVIPNYKKYHQPWKRVKDFPWFFAFIQDLKKRQHKLIKNGNKLPINQTDLIKIENIFLTLENKLNLTLVPLYGDVNPGNILIGKNKSEIYLIDQAPFFIGNQLADITEFGSYCLLNSFPWSSFLDLLPTLEKSQKIIELVNLAVFIIDRAIKNYELIALFGKKELHEENALLAKKIFITTTAELTRLL